MPLPTLILGNFNLNDFLGKQVPGASVLAEGTSRGNPVPIEVAVRSWLQDGNIVATQGYDNRTVMVRIQLGGPSLTAVAELEAELVAELNKPNTLTWTPGDGVTPASVFRVITSSLDLDDTYDNADIIEARQNLRTYQLRLVCEPFVHSEDEVTAAALPATGTTTTLVDNASSATGWTATVNGVSATVTPTVGPPTTLSATASAQFGEVAIVMTRTGSITTSSTKYLTVDWQSANAGPPVPDWFVDAPLRAFGDGTELAKVSEGTSSTAGFTRTTFYVAASSVASLVLQSTSNVLPSAGQPAVARAVVVDNINRSDIKPAIGTARQLVRTIEVAGSVRTQGSIAIEHATSSLGDVLAYFWPDDGSGYTPPLRQYRSGGGSVSSDSSLVSGSHESINGATVNFDVPTVRLPAGTYTLVARIGTGAVPTVSTGTVTWAATTRLGGTDVGVTQTGTRPSFTVPVGWANVALGRFQLPTRHVNRASTAVARISLTASTTSTCLLDEAWLLSSTGQLIMVGCGTGTAASGGPAKRVFYEPATPDQPRPSITIGHAADRSDARYPTDFSSWELPELKPPRVNVLTVTSNALDASVTLRHFPRWQSHAAS